MTLKQFIIFKYQQAVQGSYEQYLWGILARESTFKALGGYYGWFFNGLV